MSDCSDRKVQAKKRTHAIQEDLFQSGLETAFRRVEYRVVNGADTRFLHDIRMRLSLRTYDNHQEVIGDIRRGKEAPTDEQPNESIRGSGDKRNTILTTAQCLD
jgi:hypothetical protein